MANKTEPDLEVFNLIVSRLTALDEQERAHIVTNVINWFKINIDLGKPSTATTTQPLSNSGNGNGANQIPVTEMSPKQFLLEKAPQSNVERVACLAYYLTHFREMPHFKTLDLSRLNTESAQPKFTNASMTVNDGSKAGFLVPAGNGKKQLSGMGEQFVTELPDRIKSKDILHKFRKRKPRRKPTKKTTK